MNDRFREFGYEITADAGFMHELFNIPRELVRQIEENYHRISSGNFGNKTIENINKLIEKYPQNPQLKNLLFSALMTRGEVQEARNYNRKILEEHPGYLFGKLNLAGEYFENGEYDRMTEALGEVMEIQDLYPERDKFHLSEVIGFNRMAVLYFTAKNNMEAAESRLEIMEKIAPDHPDTMDARMRLLEAGMEKFREGEKKRIRVKTAEKVDVEQTTKEPEFTHEEIGLLYRHGVGIGKEYLDRIQRAIDYGAVACYIQGETADFYMKNGRQKDLEGAMQLIRDNNVILGIGAHHIETIEACVDAGYDPDFWMKTLHHHDYWSAKHEEWHDNKYCFNPERTIEYMESLPQPWIAFKTMAAGAIHPREAFKYAFEKGADFICAGMYDFQMVEDANHALDALASYEVMSERKRAWRA